MHDKLLAKCDVLAEELVWLPVNRQAAYIIRILAKLDKGYPGYSTMLEDIDAAIEGRVVGGEWYE